jgi:hypothetical protein
MGLIGRALGSGAIASVGEAAGDLSEVFVANATREMELSQEAYRMALEAAAEEYRHAGSTIFDRFVNGLNRLPRPLMALGTVGLFIFAMADPSGFSARMVGLAEVPEPLWWLLGAIVGFYFGARELHYRRVPRAVATGPVRGVLRRLRGSGAQSDDTNSALTDWAGGGGADR